MTSKLINALKEKRDKDVLTDDEWRKAEDNDPRNIIDMPCWVLSVISACFFIMSIALWVIFIRNFSGFTANNLGIIVLQAVVSVGSLFGIFWGIFCSYK